MFSLSVGHPSTRTKGRRDNRGNMMMTAFGRDVSGPAQLYSRVQKICRIGESRDEP